MKLFEGGNMSVYDADGNIIASAQSIDLKKFSRTNLRKVLLETFKKINTLYKNKYNEPFWTDFKLLESGFMFSGSTEAVFDKNISDQDFMKVKDELGDIDVICDKSKRENFLKLMDSLQGKNINTSVENIGQTRAPAMIKDTQTSYIFKITFGDYSVKAQIDFEFSDFENDIPNAYSKFAHSAAWEDLKQGIKGVWHKKCMEALTNVAGSGNNILVVTSKSPLDSVENMKFKAESNNKDLSLFSFTPDGGVRTKYEPVLDKDGNQFEKDGRLIFKEVPTANSKYEKNLENIFKLIFGVDPTTSKMNKFKSYEGILQLVKEYLNDKQKEKFIEEFVRKTGSERKGWKLASTAKKDMEYRMAGWNKFNEYFKIPVEQIAKEVEEKLYPTLFAK